MNFKKLSFALIVVLVACYVVKHCMVNVVKCTDTKPTTTSGGITLYGRMSCGYTVKMRKLLDESRIPYTFMDTETKKGSLEMKKYGGSGVPFIRSTKTGKTTTGFQPVEKMLKALA